MKIVREKTGALDDFTIGYGHEQVVGVHLERMDHGHVWLGIDLADGTTVHVDIARDPTRKTKINAWLRG